MTAVASTLQQLKNVFDVNLGSIFPLQFNLPHFIEVSKCCQPQTSMNASNLLKVFLDTQQMSLSW
jgi:hypothetical protein